jgi:hypothetical protein
LFETGRGRVLAGESEEDPAMTDPNPIYTELVAEREAVAETVEPETMEEPLSAERK